MKQQTQQDIFINFLSSTSVHIVKLYFLLLLLICYTWLGLLLLLICYTWLGVCLKTMN